MRVCDSSATVQNRHGRLRSGAYTAGVPTRTRVRSMFGRARAGLCGACSIPHVVARNVRAHDHSAVYCFARKHYVATLMHAQRPIPPPIQFVDYPGQVVGLLNIESRTCVYWTTKCGASWQGKHPNCFHENNCIRANLYFPELVNICSRASIGAYAATNLVTHPFYAALCVEFPLKYNVCKISVSSGTTENTFAENCTLCWNANQWSGIQ